VDRRSVTLLAIVGVVVIGGVALFASVPAGKSGRAVEAPASAGKTSKQGATTTTSTTLLPPLQPDGTAADGRPPQFVNVSFDGAGGLELLRQWLDVANRGHARFSFFLSGVYLLDQAHKTVYVGPHHKPGKSSVGFANVPDGMTSEQYMSTLVQQLTDARRIGHEVGTHYNGHFCSGVSNPVGTWNAADWTSEIDQFYGLAANISKDNGFAQQAISENAYQSYVRYFENSYYGNRAPVDLGNHFERWDNSAFTNALQRFVLEECVKPEVRCVPYRDLVDWLDARPPQQLAAFEAGAFPHLPRPGEAPIAGPPPAPGAGPPPSG
jgi:hypothetical protein